MTVVSGSLIIRFNNFHLCIILFYFNSHYLTIIPGGSKQQSVIQQLHARKGRLIVMCTEGDAASVSVGGSCRVIEVPHMEDCLQPVINIIPLQVYIYSILECLIVLSDLCKFLLSHFLGAVIGIPFNCATRTQC